LGLRLTYVGRPTVVQSADFWHSKADERESEHSNSSGGTLWNILGFGWLPIATRRTVALILVVPVGVLITAIFQKVIGLRTIGTFSPTLLAMSQVKSDWKIGLGVFALTFGIGSLFRMFFAGLRLSAVPRRGIVAVFVVLFLAIAISISEYFDFAANARAVLLPVVVTTMMIERFFIALEKEGRRGAVGALINSLVVAFCCFLIFAYTPIGPVLVALPELEFLFVGIFILIGRYSGPVLIEVLGFTKVESPEREI